MKMDDLSDYKITPTHRFSPPNQRFRIAKRCLDRGDRLSFRADQPTRELYYFLRDREAAIEAFARKRVLQQYCELALAFSLRRRKYRPSRLALEAYLLTTLDDAAIAARFDLPPMSIWWYRVAFYDVQHFLKSHQRTMHELIGIFDVAGGSALDVPRLWKIIGYKLGAAALDELFDGKGKSTESLTEWLKQQSQRTIELQQLLTIKQLDVNDTKQRELLFKLWSQEQSRRPIEDTPQTVYEQHLKAMLESLPWSVGEDGEMLSEDTPLAAYDKLAAELRDDDLLRVSAGESIDITLPERLPPQRRRTHEFKIGEPIANAMTPPPAPSPRDPTANPGNVKPKTNAGGQ